MGLFSLFGGKKKQATAEREVVGAPAVPDAPERAAAGGAGAAQVKLRLKLAASLRSGAHADAYEAAKMLADMQARAGRRVGRRVWSAEADRILALQNAA